MPSNRPSGRVLHGLIALTLLMAACSPPPAIYSRDPVDPAGNPLKGFELVGLELQDHTRYELAEGESLGIEQGVLVIRSRVQPDGSRRQRVFDLDTVELLKARSDAGDETWLPVATPPDLTEFDVLPRLASLTTVDGESLLLGDGIQASWSSNQLGIRIEEKGTDEIRTIPLTEVQTITLADTHVLRSTLLSPKFWIVAGVAAGVAWWVSGLEDSDNLAVN